MLNARSKLAIATWRAPREGNIYAKIELDASALIEVKEKLQAQGDHVTVTHMVGKAVAMALDETPDLNGRVFWGKFRPFPNVAVCFLVALNKGQNLGFATLESVPQIKLTDIARQLSQKAEKLKNGRDDEFKKNQGLLKKLPVFLIRPMVWLSGVLASGFGIGVKALGLKAFPFGSCIVTSVGMFGVDEGYAPPTPFARVPLYLAVGQIKKRPWVVDDEIVIRPILTMTFTVDHRVVDGAPLAIMANRFRFLLEKKPEKLV